MKLLKNMKEGWENLWLPITHEQKKKTKVELERDKKYEARWVWYHTLMAIELLVCNILLLWIAIAVS
jgi:hypothetical protein